MIKINFEEIDIKKHRDTVVEFRKGSFKVSFGDTSGFGEEEDYLRWLDKKIKDFPEGFVLVEEDGKYIGQLELTIRAYEGIAIGYVNLYYLIPEMRGLGKGKELHDYAKKVFLNNKVSEYHLRVSPSNTTAIKFYHTIGMEEIGPEVDGKVIRLKGYL
ncbi:GNAT family N-acetyltransferase [Paraliobacillus zengyii]|uniref:GNAT family N-acetyltransferase n=1 Tax=Paraliobacillus zengyii TaxID=2213194 RepID=UPI0030D51F41